MPRTATVVASQTAELLEIRWQGIREIMRFDKDFKTSVETKYRENALFQHLAETEIFKNLPNSSCAKKVCCTFSKSLALALILN